MTTKTISVMEDAYELLKRAKLPSESFSDTIRRTLSKKKPLDTFFASWNDTEAKAIEDAINKRRAHERKKKPLKI